MYHPSCFSFFICKSEFVILFFQYGRDKCNPQSDKNHANETSLSGPVQCWLSSKGNGSWALFGFPCQLCHLLNSFNMLDSVNSPSELNNNANIIEALWLSGFMIKKQSAEGPEHINYSENYIVIATTTCAIIGDIQGVSVSILPHFSPPLKMLSSKI